MVLQQEKAEKYLGGILSMAQNLSALVRNECTYSIDLSIVTKIMMSLIKILISIL